MKVIWSPIYYKIEGNYFKGKLWVLYKSKTKTRNKGSEITVLLISVTTLNIRHFCPPNQKCQFDSKLCNLNMQVAPKISF